LAWSLAGFCVGLFVLSVLFFALARSANVPGSWDVNFSLLGQLAGASFLIFPLVGALIAARHPRNPIGWILLADGLFWMLSGVMDYYAVYGVADRGSVPFPVGVAGINTWLWVPAVGLLGTYVFLLFPDGRLPSRRWRSLAWLSGAVILWVSVGTALAPGPLQNLGGVQNPFGLIQPGMMPVFWATLPLLPLCMVACVLSLVLRYRRSRGEERQQIKWIAFAASVVGLLYLVAMITSLVFPSEGWFQPGSRLWLDLVAYAALFSFTLVPIAVGIAVLRYRLYEIDLVINRTLVYGPLTISLVLVYVGSVVSLQYLFRLLTGESSQLVIVASTLAIAALFNPLRRRIQRFIDHRFYRRKYDARKTLELFSARLRDETDLQALNAELVNAVQETVQPERVSLWLREPSAGAKSGDDL
jgi:MFS family permease